MSVRARAAERFGLPLLPPSKASGGDFKKGANMAIIGATAMDFDFFKSRGLGASVWNDGSLGTQIQWFQQLMPSICGTDAGCKSYFSNSLFIVGEFGGNDYNAALFTPGKGMAEARSYVPQVVDRITTGVEVQVVRHPLHDAEHTRVLMIGRTPKSDVIFATNETNTCTDADRAGRRGRRSAGRAADRVLPGVPDAVPELEQGRLRRDRLPQELQQPVQLPQRVAEAGAVGPPEQARRRQAHVRRLLRPGHGHGPVTGDLRYVRRRHSVSLVSSGHARTDRRAVPVPIQLWFRTVYVQGWSTG
ncbi:acetylajmalan esterase [Setaria viridis]|uniref:acetylajmalan esterase n=1 Tax=Setaria viridis TaxID=4556 RepID=UPI003B3A0DB1